MFNFEEVSLYYILKNSNASTLANNSSRLSSFFLSFFFQTFEYFRETTELLEQHGSISVRNGKVAILQDKDVRFSANMWRPILTAYWVS